MLTLLLKLTGQVGDSHQRRAMQSQDAVFSIQRRTVRCLIFPASVLATVMLFASVTRAQTFLEVAEITESRLDDSRFQAVSVSVPDAALEQEIQQFRSETSPLRQATLLQPTPFVQPRSVVPDPTATPEQSTSLTSQLFGPSSSLDRSVLRQARIGVAAQEKVNIGVV